MGRCSCWHHRSIRPRRPLRARGAAPTQRPRGAPCSRRQGRPGGPEARPRERGDFGRREGARLAIVAHCHSAWCDDPVRSNPHSPHRAKRPRAAGWPGARVGPAPAVISPARGCDLTGVCHIARGAGRRRAGRRPLVSRHGSGPVVSTIVDPVPSRRALSAASAGGGGALPHHPLRVPVRRGHRRGGGHPVMAGVGRDPASAPRRWPPRGRPLHVADRPAGASQSTVACRWYY